jgi:hypothetical protein
MRRIEKDVQGIKSLEIRKNSPNKVVPMDEEGLFIDSMFSLRILIPSQQVASLICYIIIKLSMRRLVCRSHPRPEYRSIFEGFIFAFLYRTPR